MRRGLILRVLWVVAALLPLIVANVSWGESGCHNNGGGKGKPTVTSGG